MGTKWTERQWANCNRFGPLLDGGTNSLLAQLPANVRDRKIRQAIRTIFHRILRVFDDQASQAVADIIDEFADGSIARRELHERLGPYDQKCPALNTWGYPFGSIGAIVHDIAEDFESTILYLVLIHATDLKFDGEPWYVAKDFGKVKDLPQIRKEENLLMPQIRDIFGNPFRPAAIDPTWLEWNDGTLVKLARTIYDDRRFDLMPILGDALEDALCDNADMLDHCRGAGPHVRGCWVVDLILGRT